MIDLAVAQGYLPCTNYEWESQLIEGSVSRKSDARDHYILNGVYIPLGSSSVDHTAQRRALFGGHRLALWGAKGHGILLVLHGQCSAPEKSLLYYSFTPRSPLCLKWEEGGVRMHSYLLGPVLLLQGP